VNSLDVALFAGDRTLLLFLKNVRQKATSPTSYLYNSAAESFHINKLCNILPSREVHF